MKFLWKDAHTFGTWTDIEESKIWAKNSWNSYNVSYGRLIFETKDYIVICASLNKEANLIGDITIIPKSLLKKCPKKRGN